MSIYNCILIKYKGAQQLRYYSDPIHEGDSVTEKRVEARSYMKEIRGDRERTPEQIEHSLHASKSRTIQNIYAVARSNEWDYFVTLTFDRTKTDASDYVLVSRRVSDWLANTRRYCPHLKYLVVPELHKDGKNWHIHALFGNCPELPLSDSGKRHKGQVIYNLPTYRWGFSTATKVRNNFAVCHYVTKYITKDLVFSTKNRKRVWISRNVDRPTAEKAYLPSWQIDNLILENGSKIKHAQEKGDDLKSIKYIEFEGAEDCLEKYKPKNLEIMDGWEPCVNDWDSIENEDAPEEVEIINRIKQKRDESLERMRKVMRSFGRRPDESAPLWPNGVPDRIRAQRLAKNLPSYPEDKEAFLPVLPLPEHLCFD